MVNVQEWLDKEYFSEEKEKIEEINSRGLKLEDKLIIASFHNLKKVNLRDAKGITRIEIKDCPNIEEIFTYDNQIEEMVGLDELFKLRKLDFAKNQIKKMDVSQNINLTYLVCHDNPDLKEITGVENLSRLSFFNGKWSSNATNKGTVLKFDLFGLEKKDKELTKRREYYLHSKHLLRIEKQLIQEFRKLKIYLEKVAEFSDLKQKITYLLNSAQEKKEFDSEEKKNLVNLVKETINSKSDITKAFKDKISEKETELRKTKERLEKIKEETEENKKNWIRTDLEVVEEILKEIAEYREELENAKIQEYLQEENSAQAQQEILSK
ncbi:13651_t:CDS:2 [Entrophospora sp. SA101]|nr:13651_t:CDS:2 [Entrophospora sp. SA101]